MRMGILRPAGRLGAAALAILVMTGAAFGGVRKPYGIDDLPDVCFRYPLITAPLLSGSVPRIDGEVEASEWSGASQSMPLIDRITGGGIQDQAFFWIAYSEQGLYLAFRVKRPDYAPRPKPMENDRGDYMGFYLRDKFGQQYGVGALIDAYGNRGTRLTGNHDLSPDEAREWSAQARLIESGYEGELFLPFTFFERRTPRQDDLWELQVINHRATPTVQQGVYSVVDNATPLKDYGYLRFGDVDTPPVQLVAMSPPRERTLGAAVQLAEGARQGVVVHAALFQQPNDRTEYYSIIKSLAGLDAESDRLGKSVSPTLVGQEALRHYRFIDRWSGKVAGGARTEFSADVPPGRYLMHMRVFDNEGKLLSAGTWGVRRHAELEVRAHVYPLLGQHLVVLADYNGISTSPGPGSNLKARLLNATGGSVAESTLALSADRRDVRLQFPITGVRPGQYTLETQLLEGGGKVLASVERSVRIPETPAWWGNNLGKVEAMRQVPLPWTPLRATTTTLDMWGRTLTYNNRLMPTSIIHANAGVELLAAPVTLQLDVAQELVYGAANLQRDPWRVVRQTEISSLGGSLRGRLTVDTEFDGFSRHTLALSPVGQRPLQIAGLVLEIPLRRSIVEFYHVGPAGTLADANPAYWAAGRVPEAGLTLPFVSNLWLGNADAGIDLTFEWDRDWFPLDQPDAVTVRFDKEVAIVRVHMVRRDTSGPRSRVKTVTQPVSFEWGMLVTPAKPMSSTYAHDVRLTTGDTVVNRMSRRVDATDVGSLARALAGNGATAHLTVDETPSDSPKSTVVWPTGHSLPGFNPGDTTTSWRSLGMAEAVKMRQRQGLRWNVFQMFAIVPVDWAELDDHWREMVIDPERGSGTRFRHDPTPPFQDWYLSRLQQTIDSTGVNGIFQKNAVMPRLSTNLSTGAGWYDEEGRLRGKYPIFSQRRLQQRLWLLLHSGPDKQGLVMADSMPYIFPTIESFVDVHVAGQYVRWQELLQQDRDQLISRYYGHAFGVPVVAFNNNAFDQPSSRLSSWGPALLLDARFQAAPEHLLSDLYPAVKRATYDDESAIVVGALWGAWRTFPWSGSLWSPWWKSGEYVKSSNSDLLIALHRVPGTAAMITIVNPTEEPVTASITLELAALGMENMPVRLVDTVLSQQMQIDYGKVEVQILPNRWRQLHLSRAE